MYNLKNSLITKQLMQYFFKPFELKMRVCTSITIRLFGLKSTVMEHRSKITQVSLSI